MSINKCIFTGRIAWKDEAKATQDGGMVIKFNIANNKAKDETNYIPCIAFEKTADFIYSHVNVGEQVAIEARLDVSEYVDKEGKKRKSYVFIVNKLDKYWEPKVKVEGGNC